MRHITAWRGRKLAVAATLVALASGLASFACAPRLVGPPLPPPSQWTPHAARRGMGLPPKILGAADYAALDLVQPGSVVLFSTQLGEADPTGQINPDPALQRWLERHQDVLQVVRLWPMKRPEDPRRVAWRILALHHRYPWLVWFQVANEPDIEWPGTSWPAIADWTAAVWWNVEYLRRHVPGAADIRLLFPPLAQGSPLDPEHVGYDALRASIELYLDHGDGLAGHEYWDRGDVYLVEEQWPAWLQGRLQNGPFFVTEAGRRPLPSNGQPDAALGSELLDFAARTRASLVAPFVLSSPNGLYDQFDFVDRDGRGRPQLFVWGELGP